MWRSVSLALAGISSPAALSASSARCLSMRFMARVWSAPMWFIMPTPHDLAVVRRTSDIFGAMSLATNRLNACWRLQRAPPSAAGPCSFSNHVRTSIAACTSSGVRAALLLDVASLARMWASPSPKFPASFS